MTIREIRDKIISRPGFGVIYIPPIKWNKEIDISRLSDASILNQKVRPFMLIIRAVVYEMGEVSRYEIGEGINAPVVIFLKKFPP